MIITISDIFQDRSSLGSYSSSLRLEKTEGGKRFKSESAFWYHLKKLLIDAGYDVIKKLMYKDGHMVDDHIYYVRTRNFKKKESFAVHDSAYAVRNLAEDWNRLEPGEVMSLNLLHNLNDVGIEPVTVPAKEPEFKPFASKKGVHVNG